MRSAVRGAILAVILLVPVAARAAPPSQSCSASDTFEIATFGSRHCEITLTCPSATPTCSWRLAVSVSGVGTVHGWIESQSVECSGINSCSASKTVSLSGSQSHGYMCLMQGDPIVAVNESMTCSGTGL